MKNIISFPQGRDVDSGALTKIPDDPALIEEEALAWLIRLDGDTPPSEQDLQALKVWMARSPAHTREIENLGAFWADLSLTELNVPLIKPTLKPAGSLTSGWAALTGRNWAAFASVLGVALLLQQVLSPGWFGMGAIDSTNGVYVTAIGKQIEIPLADGSVAHLNTNSQITVDYRDGYRSIRLVQGEAHFDVAKDKTRPFRVYAGKGRVQALGTAFTVYLHEQDIDVLVTEGKVELAAQAPASGLASATQAQPSALSQAGNRPATRANSAVPEYYVAVPVERLGQLSEGQGATIVIAQPNREGSQSSAGALKAMDAETLKQKDAWRQGLLVFTGDTLEDVVAEISRYTSVDIKIIDPVLKKIRIGGQFHVGDLDGMFQALETNFDLHVVQLDKNRVHILAAEKPTSKNQKTK